MTISASEPAADGDLLARSLMLYRDLSGVLIGQIEQLKAGTAGEKEVREALGAFRRISLAAIEAEAGLDKRNRAGGGGAGVELDLDAARAEVLEVLQRLGPGAAEG
jgi:hypothetical protein